MHSAARRPRSLLVGGLALIVGLAGCGSSHDSENRGLPGARIDSQLVFGGPPECATRDLCLGAEEQRVYGLRFKEVQKLDAGGPVTVKALKSGTIQVGELFTGSSVIDPSFVQLRDDKGSSPPRIRPR